MYCNAKDTDCLQLENQQNKSEELLIDKYFVGMTGFEPATTRPPAVYANRTAPHPAFL